MSPLAIEPELQASLLRYWAWAEHMRELFEYYLKTEWPIPQQPFEERLDNGSIFATSIFTTMCLWYALLYAPVRVSKMMPRSSWLKSAQPIWRSPAR